MFLRVFLVLNAIHLISDVFLVLKFSHENVLVPLMNRPLVINHNFIFKFRSLQPFGHILRIQNVLLVYLISCCLNSLLLKDLLPSRRVFVQPVSGLQ